MTMRIAETVTIITALDLEHAINTLWPKSHGDLAYVYFRNQRISKVSLREETLSDGSMVTDLILS